MGPRWNGYRTRNRAGLVCPSIQTVMLCIPFLSSFPWPLSTSQVPELCLSNTQESSPVLRALSKPQSLGLVPHDPLGEELFPEIQLKPVSSNPSCLSAPPYVPAPFLSVFHQFLVSPKLYLGSFLQQQLHAVGISYHAGAVQGFEGAVQAVHISALGSTGTPPGSGIHPSHPLRKG